MAILYGVSPSPFVRKTRMVLQEKGLDYTFELVIPMAISADYKKISPLGKIPAYEDENGTLADSSVICAYLEKAHPTPSLYPSEPYAYGRALWFEEFADTGLMPIIGPNIFFQKVIGPRYMDSPPDEDLVNKAYNEDLPPRWDYLEQEIADKDYLVDDRFTIADISIAGVIVNLHHSGFVIDENKWPKLAAYVENILSRENFAKLIKEEQAFLAEK